MLPGAESTVELASNRDFTSSVVKSPDLRDFSIVAHQGAHEDFAPNSLASFRTALARAAEAIECDVFCVDEELLVIHPEGYRNYVDPAGLPRWAQISKSAAELRGIQVDGRQLVPTLEEVLELCAGKTELQIELKGPGSTLPTIELLKRKVSEGKLNLKDIVIMSFDYPNESESRLQVVREQLPEARLGLSIREVSELDAALNKARVLGIEIIDLPRREVTSSVVRRAHEAGLHVTAYHARTSDEVIRCATLGLDSVRADIFNGPALSCYQTPSISTEIATGLLDLGFFNLLDHFPEIVTAQRRSCNEHVAEEVQKSFIPTQPKAAQPGSNLVIDIGGTSIKAGTRVIDRSGQATWKFLFEKPYTAINISESAESSYEAFCLDVATTISSALENERHCFQGLALIWSNLMQPRRVEALGIEAEVVRTAVSYRKGEPFVADLKTGDQIGRPMMRALQACGINAERLIVTNDLPLIFAAGEKVDGAMVACTGVNGSLIDTKDNSILNGELGRVIIPPQFLSSVDQQSPEFHIGHAIGGRYLPESFINHLLALHRTSQLFPVFGGVLQDATQRRFLDMPSIGKLCAGNTDVIQQIALAHGQDISAEEVRHICEVAESVVVRAARMAGVVAVFSILQQLSKKDFFKVAVDSRLAREIPVFKSHMSEQFQMLLRRFGKKGEIQFLEPLSVPGGQISIAMQGAGSALNRLQ